MVPTIFRNPQKIFQGQCSNMNFKFQTSIQYRSMVLLYLFNRGFTDKIYTFAQSKTVRGTKEKLVRFIMDQFRNPNGRTDLMMGERSDEIIKRKRFGNRGNRDKFDRDSL